jgi:predicted Zn-dependent protease
VIDRRELLRSLGATAAVAALAPLGCGRGKVKAPTNVEVGGDALRQALRDAVTTIGASLDRPRAWVLQRRRMRVLVDVALAQVVEERQIVCVLSARTADGRRVEQCFDDVQPLNIAAAAMALVANAGGGGGRRREPAKTIPTGRDHAEAVEVDPAKLTHEQWLERAREIARRGEEKSTSRIVYRAAWIRTDDDMVWTVGEDGDHRQRLVRSRLGATFVAWQGSTPQFGEAEIAGGFGPAVTHLSDDSIEEAAADALALFTPTTPPSGRQIVLLDPGVVAALVDSHVSAHLEAWPDRPGVKITDDPAVGRFASYWLDDDGVPNGRARRAAPDWRIVDAPAQLALPEGATTAQQLESGINDGLVIEGLRDAHVDDAGMVVMRVSRGRQLTSGGRTGRQWGDLEVRGKTSELLSDALDTSRERREIAVSDTPARAVLAPWLLTRAHVGNARGRG